MKTLAVYFRKAPFPAVLTALSVLLFLAGSYYCLVESPVPMFLDEIPLAVPALCFGTITSHTVRGKLNHFSSAFLTVLSIIVLPVVLFFGISFFSLDAESIPVTDVGSYSKVLRLNKYPSNALIQDFPAKIPADAKNTKFLYHPEEWQGSEDFELRFDTVPDSLQKYETEFAAKAKWTGKFTDGDAEMHGISRGDFELFPGGDLPDDFTIYLFDSEPYQGGWNHGTASLAAVSTKRQEVLFYADKW